MLRSIEMEHLARYDFEIAFRATIPATRTTAIESDHAPRSHSIDFRIRGSHRTPYWLRVFGFSGLV